MYLGNLGHANNPELLRALGITQILSVGEIAMWREGDLEKWGKENVCVVQGVQDNGIDPLTEEFARCLEFIGQ
jgi:dual specificity MAP kinase phosphatase